MLRAYFKKGLALALTLLLLLGSWPGSAPRAAASSEGCSAVSPIAVDGEKDAVWDSVPVLGTSGAKGWQEFHIDNLRLTNDCTYLYYWIDAVNVPNWGDDGHFVNIALKINGTLDSAQAGNPWSYPFTFENTAEKPDFHIMQRIKGDAAVNYAALYASSNLTSALLSSTELKGAEFAVNRTKGFEGKIPLAELSLQIGDSIQAIAVLSGNNGNEHGAFDVIPEANGNEIAGSWNVSEAPNKMSSYSAPYTIEEPKRTLYITGTNPSNDADDVSINSQQITVQFNEPITLIEDAAVKPSIDKADYTLSVNGDRLIFDLEEALAYKTAYTVTIPANSIENFEGGYQFTFTTEVDPSLLKTYRINYFRYDGNQSNWDMWIWQEGKDGAAYDFTSGQDGFATAEYAFEADSINVILRPKSWSSQEVTRTIAIPAGQSSVEAWIIQDVPEVFYRAEDADISARIRSAIMDSSSKINITASTPIDPGMLGSFKLIDRTNNNDEIPVTVEAAGENGATLTITDPSHIDVRHMYEVTSSSFASAKVTMRRVLDDSRYYYGGSDLGLAYSGASSAFKLWAPTAMKVTLALYDDAGVYDASGTVRDHTGGQESEMSRSDNGVWATSVQGDLAGKYYMYKVEFADGSVHYAVDPYARAVAANGARTAIVALSGTDPTDWAEDKKPPMVNPTDAIVYELHVRDFSINGQSGVSEANKGKFLAFTESGLVDGSDNKLGVDHLAELGITHLQLLPSYDFKTVNELTVNDPSSSNAKFNWGYDPQNYNVPEGSYSSDPADPAARIREFKQMVKALHDQGIRVVMDVVYNHTFEIEEGPFNKIVPGYFYRTNDSGIYTNGSGVSNEIASERPMVRKFIKDSVRYWAEEYNIDGFRFDLMGLIDTPTMMQITDELKSEVDPTLLIYGEPWTGGSSPLAEQTLKGSQKDKGFAVFNDNFRGAIKGDSDGGEKGFATGSTGSITGIKNGIIGSTTDFTNNSAESINYVTAHDNFNLWDKVVWTQGIQDELGMLQMQNGQLVGGGSIDAAVAAAEPYKYVDSSDVFANETVKRSLLANGIVLTSQGIPFIHAGDELLRTKYGDHNSYKSPDAINMIRWENKASFELVYEYYKGLIELRKEHPAFRMIAKEMIDSHLQIYRDTGNVVAFKLADYANNDSWQNIVVIYNGNTTASDVTLPAGSSSWKVVVNATQAGTDTIETITGASVSVPGLSMMVLFDEEEESYVPEASSIAVKLPRKAVQVGDNLIAAAEVKDQRGKWLAGAEVQWESSDPSVVTIGANGRITALRNGQTTIKAKAGSVEGTALLHVDVLAPATITVSGSTVLYATFSGQLIAVVKDQYGQVMANPSIAWSSSDTKVATVDAAGRVLGKAPGTSTITAVSGSASAAVSIEVKPYVKRYIQFQYDRQDGDYTGWNLWVWGTGVKDDQIDFTIADGKAVARVEIAPGVTRVGFIVRKGNWEAKDPDMDRNVDVSPGDEYVKVLLKSGQASYAQMPSINGPVISGGNATFYYRDDALFQSKAMDAIDGVKLLIGGGEYDMAYDAVGEYFYYTLQSITPGEHEYAFRVTKDEADTIVTDPKNTVNGKSILKYEIVDMNVSGAIEPSAIHHGQNALLKVTIDKDASQLQAVYADLSAIGGGNEVSINKALMAQSIAVRDDIPAGVKQIPIRAVDIYGNSHEGLAELTVNAKIYDGELDFDWEEARIYFMLTDRFKDGDSSNNDPNGEGYEGDHPETYHGGDFQGIIDKLDYIESLGINTIWITPIVDNIDWNVGSGQPWQYQYGYHGYWTKDFTKIDEHLGDLETFKALIDQAHDRGIKIMVDVVLNHAGYGMKVTDSGPSSVTNFPTSEEQALLAELLRLSPGSGDIVGELAGLPDLMTENPAVREQIVAWQTDWLNRARTDRGDTIDYFRVDTVKHVESETWIAFKNALTALQPDFKLIGEVYGAGIDSGMGYLNSGQMDSLLDFEFKYKARDFLNMNIDAVEAYLERRNEGLNNTATLGQFLSSHDEDGFLIAHAGGDKSKLKVAAALQIAAKGQPIIYYGEEIGRTGQNADFDEGIIGENRSSMPWDQVEAEADLLTHYSKLLNIRAKYSKIFSKGTHVKTAGGDAEGYLVFERSYEGKSVWVGLNPAAEGKTVALTLPLSEGTILVEEYSGAEAAVGAGGAVSLLLPGRAEGGTFMLAVKQKTIEPEPEPEPEPITSVTNAGKTSTTVSLAWMAPIGAEKIVLEQSIDGGLTWTEAVGVSLANDASAATAAGLTPNTAYMFRLVVTGGTNEGISNTVEVTTDAAAGSGNSGGTGSGDPSVRHVGNPAANSEGVIHVAIDGQIRRVVLPAAANALNRSNTLEIQGDALTLHIPGAVLEQLKGLVSSNELAGAVIEVQVKPLDAAALAEWLKGLSGQAKADVTKAGAAYEIRLELRKADGTVIALMNPAEPIGLSLKSDTDNKLGLTGIYYGSEEGALRYAGGKYIDGKLIAAVKQFGVYAVLLYQKQFDDVPASHWASEAIVQMAARGIILGVNEDEFAPSATITRAQFATFIARALSLKAEQQAPFSDVAGESYYSQYVAAAYEAGIILGKTNDRFDPNGQLSREEMAVMIIRAYEYVAGQIESREEGRYTDDAAISHWAKLAVNLASELGILQGKGDNRFDPQGILTRAEAAQAMMKLLASME